MVEFDFKKFVNAKQRLILPWDQETPTDPTTPIGAYFVHHTPEFWTDSPHNFQRMMHI